MRYRRLLLAGMIALAGATGHVAGQTRGSFKKITITFDHMVGNEALVMGNTYVNVLGDTITIQKFRYYVSNFAVITPGKKTIRLKPQYFLIDESEPVSRTIILSVPANVQMSNIRFMLGVDSAHNVAGIQTGALDPAKGMFWTWNSGYIMAKLEGISPSAHVAGNIFTYHIGGFRWPTQTMRIIELPVAARSSSLHIIADINRWFRNNTDLHITETPVCHSPGKPAARIADNYAGMFSIKPMP